MIDNSGSDEEVIEYQGEIRRQSIKVFIIEFTMAAAIASYLYLSLFFGVRNIL